MSEDPKKIHGEAKSIALAVAAACAALGVAFVGGALIQGQSHEIVSAPSAPITLAPDAITSGQLVRGRTLFAQECVSCHGSHAQGGIGPDLRRLEISDAQISMTIKNGVKPEMPAYGGKYHDADIDSLTKYIRSFQSERKLTK